jgi:AbrB family looped-hinge helix DNA binding protein
MKTVLRINAKGQITFPKAVRELCDLSPGTEVEIEIVDGGVRIQKAAITRRPGTGVQLVAHMRGRGDVPVSTDEILAITRGR